MRICSGFVIDIVKIEKKNTNENKQCDHFVCKGIIKVEVRIVIFKPI